VWLQGQQRIAAGRLQEEKKEHEAPFSPDSAYGWLMA
jgi:hypothetical protein